MKRLGFYWAPAHNQRVALDYIQRLHDLGAAPIGRILGPDVQHIADAYRAAPRTRLALRFWSIDDGGYTSYAGYQERRAVCEMLADPVGAAKRHVAENVAMIDRLYAQATERSLPMPPRSQLIISAINEPPTWVPEYRPAIAEYNRIFGLEAAAVGLSAALGVFAVGHPHEWPPVWDWFAPVAEVIRQVPGHLLELHEYWQPEGPFHVWNDEKGNVRNDWGALAGRHMACPFDVPILIGECGVDGIIYNRASDNSGFANHMEPRVFAQQLTDYAAACGPKVVAVLPFMLDHQDRKWASFDHTPANAAILNRIATVVENKPSIYVPSVVVGKPSPVEPPKPDTWRRSIEWVLRWEGGLSLDPNDPGNYWDGKLVGTKYGISAAVWGGKYDIPNLTKEQAEQIYFEHYWRASGADRLEWPLCLIVFDTAVLHGTGTAKAWLKEVGANPFLFFAKRQGAYLKSDKWSHFGKGWIGRTTELAEVMGQS